ncbi:DUF2069 domain-containing protein [Leucothrix pacifica]|uniref:DUF2069 domain-containing protein n=1 Tax=Leucothrix pacifica TaxID=1247513 RepID=A0A317CPC7_9GAMM|nr:DUF2069 domain-containing protein [Leucothrix pacifica]PWR00526.1 DUF2069 domain-containing protein [Leucothrix pacifica]
MSSIKRAYALSVVSMLGLLTLIIVWNGWLAPTQGVPVSFELAIFCIPLLFFLRGTLSGKRSTHVSLMVVAFFYFMAGVWHIVEPSERSYGIAIVVLSFGMYLGGYFYAKCHDKIAQARLDAEARAESE